METEEQRIKSLLDNGFWIRYFDGRYEHGFVGLDELNSVINSGYAETFKYKDVTMVRKSNGEE